MHAPPLPALEYVPGAHCSGSEVTDEEHLDPAGHVVHVSVAPFEYVPFPQVSWAVAPMGAFARWPGATVVQPVTYLVVCSSIGKASQSDGSQRITMCSTHCPSMFRMGRAYTASRRVQSTPPLRMKRDSDRLGTSTLRYRSCSGSCSTGRGCMVLSS